MPVAVEIDHPTGLFEPKLIGKTVNGTSTKQTLQNGHSYDRKDAAATKGVHRNQELNEDDRAVLVLRNLIFDICNQNGGGHGGSALGMAAIGVALYKYTMRYNPSDPSWFDRDRFVLSNGKSPNCAA